MSSSYPKLIVGLDRLILVYTANFCTYFLAEIEMFGVLMCFKPATQNIKTPHFMSLKFAFSFEEV